MNLCHGFYRTLNQTWLMRNRRCKQKNAPATFPHGLAKQGTCHPIEIAPRFYSAADFWGTNLPPGLPRLALSKAFHNPAPDGAEIQGWRGNRDLCSIRAIAISLPNDPATTLFSGAISSLAVRLSFFGHPSRQKTVTRTAQNIVFAYTQHWRPSLRFNLPKNKMCGMTVASFNRRQIF